MSPSRCFLLPVLACSTLLLTGALNHEAVPSAPPRPRTDVDAPDWSGTPGGAEVLDAAAATFAPERVPWVQMTLWQQVKGEDFTYVAEGRYLAAPDHRLRLDLKVRVGQAEATLQMVSNGSALRYAYGADEGAAPFIQTVPLTGSASPPGAAPLPAAVAQHRDRILSEHGCPGVAPLLRTVRERLRKPCWKRGRWNEQDVVEILGEWSPGPGPLPGTTAGAMPMLQPRKCKVSLDARTLWPHRIEWWGSPSPQKRNELLMQMEFRDPVLNQPLPPERCAREFALAPVESGTR